MSIWGISAAEYADFVYERNTLMYARLAQICANLNVCTVDSLSIINYPIMHFSLNHIPSGVDRTLCEQQHPE